MPELAAAEIQAWSSVASATGAVFKGTTMVLGPGARQVGEALLGLGASTVIAEETPMGEDAPEPPEDAVDTVVLLHAWAAPDRVDVAARTAVGWLRPGGWLVLADLDLDLLSSSPPTRYPSSVLYRRFPEVRHRIAVRTASSLGLATAAIRAGLDDKATVGVDRPVGAYATPSEFLAAVEFGAWRGLEHLTAEQYAELLSVVASIDVAAWPLVDLEPWTVVAGAARV